MYLPTKWIIVDFLRAQISDPRTARATSSKINNFTATAGQTEFELTPTSGKSLSHIISVTVNATSKSKWTDYYIDFRDQKIIFYTGLTLSDAIIVTFGESSSNWIYPDKASEKLSTTAFPRMNVLVIAAPGKRLGNYKAPVESAIMFQIDIWTKEKQDGQVFIIDGRKYTGEALAEYLAFKITEAFEEQEDELHPALYSYEQAQGPRDLPFNTEMQCHHKTVEFELNSINVGRIS